MTDDLDTIIIKSLFVWKDFIDKSLTPTDRAHYLKKFNGLYNYAQSYNYQIPEPLKQYHEEVNKNDATDEPRSV